MADVNWITVERHPVSAKYVDIAGADWERLVANMRKNGVVKINGQPRRVTLHEGMVIDGWQMLRACRETDNEPEFWVLELPDGMTLEEWVATVNDYRRHENDEMRAARIDARQRRVAEARTRGESLRVIAEREGVSAATVRTDIEAAEENGYDTSPPDGRVTGRDKRSRSATAPMPAPDTTPSPSPAEEIKRCPMCARRIRVGLELPEKCPDCAALQEPRPNPSGRSGGRARTSRTGRQNGSPIFDDRAVIDMIGKITRALDGRADVYGKGERHNDCVTKLDAFYDAYIKWQRETT